MRQTGASNGGEAHARVANLLVAPEHGCGYAYLARRLLPTVHELLASAPGVEALGRCQTRTRTPARSAKIGLRCALLSAASVSIATATPAHADHDVILNIGAPLALTGALNDEGKKQEDVWSLWLEKGVVDSVKGARVV